MTIGDKIRKIREAKDYSQEYMAAKLHISQPSYARIESGGTRLSTERLEKIAELLDLKPELILNFEDRQASNNQRPATMLYAVGPRIVSNYTKTIELLEHEVRDLREERNRLLTIIEQISGRL